MIKNCFLIASLLSVVLPATASHARTLYVSTTNLTVRGTSWEEPVNLRTALFRADDGDEIWVKSGFYEEPIVLKPGVSIYGGFIGDETSIDQRIPFANDSIVGSTDLPYVPGPIIIAATGTTIDGLWIGYGDAGEGRGGGIRCHGVSDVRIANCFFRSNRTDSSGGGISIRDSFNVVVEGSIFLSNRAGRGGQISVFASSSVLIANSLFIGGGAETRLGSGSAADISSGEGLSIEIVNCTLGIGALSDDGTVVSLFGGKRLLRNCTIAARGIEGAPLVDHCNLYSPDGSDFVDGGENIFADPLFRGALPGHETEFDPMNYSLTVNSPCIDAGTDTELFLDLGKNPRPVDVAGRGEEGGSSFDMGAYEFQLKKSDLNRDGRTDAEDLILFREEWHE